MKKSLVTLKGLMERDESLETLAGREMKGFRDFFRAIPAGIGISLLLWAAMVCVVYLVFLLI